MFAFGERNGFLFNSFSELNVSKDFLLIFEAKIPSEYILMHRFKPKHHSSKEIDDNKNKSKLII